MRQGRPAVRNSIAAAVALVASAAACSGKAGTSPPHAPVVASVAPAAPVCGPPKQILVAQKSDDGESSRLLVLGPKGMVLWQGPSGSGESPGAWSPNGALLAYAVGQDLIVHRDRGPDKLVFRGLVNDDGDPLFSFSRDGRWLAARGADGVHVVDAAESRNLEPVSIDTGIGCSPNGIYWSQTSDRLVVTCDGGELHVWDSATRADSKREIDAAYVLGWWPSAADTLLVQRDDDSLWLQPLAGAATQLRSPSIGDEGELSIDSIVPRSGLVVLTDTLSGEGYARTLWLSAGGEAPPMPWLDGSVMGIAYSSDGAWAVFTTAAADGMDEAGDVYLARVGESRVHRVAAAPHYDEEDEDDEEIAGDQAYYVGYAAPAPRPDPTSVCPPAHVGSGELLDVEQRYRDDQDQAFVTSGGAVHIVANGRVTLLSGDRSLDAGDASMVTIQDARPLPDGGWLLSDPATTYWRGADSRELAHMPRFEIGEAVVLPGGGLAYASGSDAIELRGADGRVVGGYHTPTLIASVFARPGGLAVALVSGQVELLDNAGHRVGGIDAGEGVPLAALPGGIVAVAPDYGDDQGDEAPEDPPLTMVFYDRAGHRSASAVLSTPDGDSTVLDLFTLGDEAVAVVGEERPRAHFVRRQGTRAGRLHPGPAPGWRQRRAR